MIVELPLKIVSRTVGDSRNVLRENVYKFHGVAVTISLNVPGTILSSIQDTIYTYNDFQPLRKKVQNNNKFYDFISIDCNSFTDKSTSLNDLSIRKYFVDKWQLVIRNVVTLFFFRPPVKPLPKGERPLDKQIRSQVWSEWGCKIRCLVWKKVSLSLRVKIPCQKSIWCTFVDWCKTTLTQIP